MFPLQALSSVPYVRLLCWFRSPLQRNHFPTAMTCRLKTGTRSPACSARRRALARPKPSRRCRAAREQRNGCPAKTVFSQFNANLTFEQEMTFKVGNGLFRKLWTSSPSSTQASDGLGPLYNARSCQGCHLKDGRGRPPRPGEEAVSLFLRLSIPPQNEAQQRALAARDILSIPEPTYGGQFQAFAVVGLQGEGRFDIEHEEIEVPLTGGETAVLQKPIYRLRDLGYGEMHPQTLMSPRVAPPMIGLGLLQAIHPADLELFADPEDQDKDGISGTVSRVRDSATGELTLGRFGWKASNATLRAQTAGAFSGDIGISTPEIPENFGDCTERQTACRKLPHGEQAHLGRSEAPDPVVDLVTFYSENLAVPPAS